MYNKNQFKKVNDKKVLHKIKKHWAVISVALLGLIGGGGAVATNASANTTTQANSNIDQANHSLNANQQSQQPKLVGNSQINHSTQLSTGIHNNRIGSNSTNSNGLTNQTIIHQANQLHKNIINNALSKSNNKINNVQSNNKSFQSKKDVNSYENDSGINNIFDSKNSNYKHINNDQYISSSKVDLTQNNNKHLFNITQAPHIVTTGKWDNVNVNYYSNDVMELTGIGNINSNDVPNLPFNSNKNDWTLKIDSNNKYTNHSLITLNQQELNQGDIDNIGGLPLNDTYSFSAVKHPIWNHFKSMYLRGLDIDDDCDNVSFNLGNIFQSDKSLKYISLTGLKSSNNSSNISSLDDAFASDTRLTNISGINYLNSLGLTNISGMFKSDTSLGKLDLSNFDTSSVNNMSDMFYNDTSLRELNLSGKFDMRQMNTPIAFSSDDVNTSGTANMFNGDKSLNKIKLNDNDIFGEYYGGSDDNNIPIEGLLVDSDGTEVTDNGLYNLTNIEGNKWYYTASNANIRTMDQNNYISDTNGKVLTPDIVDSDFHDNITNNILNNNNINTNIYDVLPNDQQNYKVQYDQYNMPFIYVKVTDNIKRPHLVSTAKWGTANVNYYSDDTMELSGYGTLKGSAPKLPFNSDKNDWKFKISKNDTLINGYANFNGDSRKSSLWNHFISIDLNGLDVNPLCLVSMISNDSSLKYVNLKGLKFNFNSYNAWEDIRLDCMFADDPKLTAINGLSDLNNLYYQNDIDPEIPSTDSIRAVTSANEMFYGDKSLKNVNLALTTSPGNMGFTSVSFSDMFSNDYSLQNVSLNISNCPLVTDGSSDENCIYSMDYMFSNDLSLKNVNISGGVNSVNNIQGAFLNDKYLTSINGISDLDTRRVLDMRNLFANDNSLKELNLSGWDTSNVHDMHHMFYDDNSLTNIILGYHTNLNKKGQDWGSSFFNTVVNSDGINSIKSIKSNTNNKNDNGNHEYYATTKAIIQFICGNTQFGTKNDKSILIPINIDNNYHIDMSKQLDKIGINLDKDGYTLNPYDQDYNVHTFQGYQYININILKDPYKSIIKNDYSSISTDNYRMSYYTNNYNIRNNYTTSLSIYNDSSVVNSAYSKTSNDFSEDSFYPSNSYESNANSELNITNSAMQNANNVLSQANSSASLSETKAQGSASATVLDVNKISNDASFISSYDSKIKTIINSNKDVEFNSSISTELSYDDTLANVANNTVTNDLISPNSSTANEANSEVNVDSSVLDNINYIITDNRISSSIANTLRTDYQQEHADENNEYINITNGMDIYNDAQINYEDELNGSSAPYNLQSLMTQNNTIASENAYDANDYSAKSSAIDSLTDLLDNRPTSANSTSTLTMSPRLLGAVPVGKPYNTNLKADNSTSNVPASYDAKAINSIANEAGYFNSEANVNDVAHQDNISSYNNDIRTLNSSANMEYSGYQSNKNVMNSYDSRASSFNNLADSVSNTMNTANVKSLASINSLYQSYFQQASSYKNESASNDRNMMSFANDIAKNYSSAKSDLKNIQSLAPNITPSSNSSKSNTSKSTKSVSVRDTFISSADAQMNSIANATNSLESTNNNISLVNSYANTIQNINNAVKKASTSYVSNETDINSNLSAGSYTSVMAQSYEDAVSSINNEAHTPSNVQSANSMSAKATSLMFDDDVYAQNISNERNIKSSLARVITGGLSSMNTDYQNAAQMLNSSEVNSASASASKLASISSSESSASASVSTANSISAESTSESQSISARNSIASQSMSRSASISASQSISVSTSASMSNMNKNASMSASTSTSISISASTSASLSASNSISMSISDSVSTSASLSQSASVSESISKSVATSTSESTSASLSASTSSSLSISTTNSFSDSASLSQSTTTSMSIANSIAESSLASSAAASVVARGGHWISVNSSVRSNMISGASEIASYNQITISNTYAMANYLDSLNTTTSELASEKSSAENYVMGFYNNKQAKNSMAIDNEAACDIKTWGEDPDFFTIFQAEPNSIVNNVRTIYEPTASAYATATGSIADKIKSLYTSQMASSSSSTSMDRSMSASSSASISQSTNASLSASTSTGFSHSTEASLSASTSASQSASASISTANSVSESQSISASNSIASQNTSRSASISASQFISASASASISIADASINNSEIDSASISASMSASASISTSISQSILASSASSYAIQSSNAMNSLFSSSVVNNDVASYNSANEFSNFISSSSVNDSTTPQSTTSSISNSIVHFATPESKTYEHNAVTQINVPIHWFYVNKTCLAHNHMSSVGKTKDYSYILHTGTVAKIVKAFKVQNHGHSYYRYEVNLNGHNYFVTGNAMFTKNEYIQPEELKSVRKAIIKIPCFMHSSFTYTKDNRVKAVHHGQVVHIKRIFNIGKHNHFMTRFELTNGLIITANRKFVKLI